MSSSYAVRAFSNEVSSMLARFASLPHPSIMRSASTTASYMLQLTPSPAKGVERCAASPSNVTPGATLRTQPTNSGSIRYKGQARKGPSAVSTRALSSGAQVA
ncbi:hypothetical protein BDV33DRAFT_177626 [Aspergillus novoparasiticus]|uniref:Uncharacterized protein n=1 Tax=Aspergillus novoparasiticus TaxID=986946 RepID=A0A5N6EK31_9EURO|nr:hypothetical protein BDV33DRAFT_177626 [Aspergillus novoparasiticus]